MSVKVGIIADTHDRLQLAWITAAEGEKFASKIKEMQSIVDKVGREEIEKTIAAFS